jgi:hypothetical protein
VEVGVGVKLPGDQVLDLSACRGIHISQTVDLAICGGAVRLLRVLADNKGEGEDKLIVVAEFEQEIRRRRRLGILK